MLFMNQWEIEDALRRAHPVHTPHLHEATEALVRLHNWTNENSDGWPYWSKPVNAARQLMTLIQSVDRYDPKDIDPKAVKRAYGPIKAFLTRDGRNGATEVFPLLPPEMELDEDGNTITGSWRAT